MYVDQSFVSPRVWGGMGEAKTALQVPAPGAFTTIDKRRLLSPDHKAYLPPDSGSSGAPGSSGSPGGSPGAPGAPGGGPGYAVVPQTVGSPSWPQQWQQQSVMQQQTVSTPVNVVTQPQLSVMFSPPQSSGDLGPMVPGDVALGMRQSSISSCLMWAAMGLALAWAVKKG